MVITDCFVDPVTTHCDHGATLDCGKCDLMNGGYVMQDRAALAYLAVMAACLLGILLFTLYFRLGAR